MYKEIIITIVIIVLVIIGDFFSQSFTEKNINEMNIELDDLQKIIEEKDYSGSKTKINEIGEKWNDKINIMAYYLEHDELEKVTTQLYEISGYIEIGQIDECVPFIYNCKFLLNHIKEKEVFNLKNIF